MKNVLIINQSAELYGADKALLELLENYPDGYCPIVVLHQDGPLKDRLTKMGIDVIHSSVIKVKRGILGPLFFLKLPFEIFRSIRTIKKELRGKKIDLVHSNAISVFIGAFYASLYRKKHLWHVHEIIEHPPFLARIYPFIVNFFSDLIVFNSLASMAQFLKFKPSIAKNAVVIHNGQNRAQSTSTKDEINEIRRNFFKCDVESLLVIGLVGRISRLKGQRVLLRAFRQLEKSYPNIHLVYVGSPPDGQEHFLQKLQEKVTTFKLSSKVTILGFTENIWPLYDAMDIVVVPSTEPESFGLVATEAMLSKKPVVGSDLGGLKEIIVHGETGFLFEAGNVIALKENLEMLIKDPEKIKIFGENGSQRVKKLFSTRQYVAGMKMQYDRLT